MGTHEISKARVNQIANAIMGKPVADGQRLVDALEADGYEAERSPENKWSPTHVNWTIWDGDEEVAGITCRESLDLFAKCPECERLTRSEPLRCTWCGFDRPQ